jgi:endonuclease/exonuclease/phosphatase family metal-dependent hydrolase
MQLRRLAANLVQFPSPVVLLGDLNMGPDRATQASGLRAATAHATFPQHDPRKQLDHILVGGPLSATSGAAMALPISDHCALSVELEGGPGLP